MIIQLVTNGVDFAITKQQLGTMGAGAEDVGLSDTILKIKFDTIETTFVISIDNVREVEENLYRTSIYHTGIVVECDDIGVLPFLTRIFPFIKSSRLVSIRDLNCHYSSASDWLRANAGCGMLSGITESWHQKDFPEWIYVQMARKLDNMVTEHRSKVNDLVDLYTSEDQFVEMDSA